MSAIDSLLQTHWAIEPTWLPRLAALAQRDNGSPTVREVQPWQKRDYEHMAGPGATKLTGGHRASLVDNVAIIPVMGPIFPRANMMTEMSGATSCNMLAIDLAAAINNNSEVGAILLLVDSPGGAVTGIADFANKVAEAARIKPVMAYVQGQACSAAYWIASAASEVAVDRTAVVGSIGVVVATARQVAAGQSGYLDVEIVSTNAPNKRPDLGANEGVAEVRRTLDALERIFIADVARGRKVTASQVVEKFGKGGLMVGLEAKSAGMVDRVQTLEFTMQGLRRVAKDWITQRRVKSAR
ncbi:S49 family peptidase [Pararhizobium gei]|uniref:S49 family peptidase n=1 Tax=Pararhizobium gei TaxID=1395951 RepID=UPI0023DC068E|nr:S49 family peptidase [Rhizobium gei]